MAEAHQAVVFAFHQTDEGIQVEFDHTVLRQVYLAGIRNYKKRLGRFKNRIINTCFPMQPSTLVVSVVGSLSAAIFGKDISFGAVQYLSDAICKHSRLTHSRAMIISSTFFGVGVFASLAYIRQWIMRRLLNYHGWMYESRGAKVSLKTKAWFFLAKIFLQAKHPKLYSYQSVLPTLPLPSVDDTINRYLTSMEPLLPPERMDQTRKLAQDFTKRGGIGRKLQFYLCLKYYWTSNYVSDWWEQFVYLYSRDPIMVNSNYYGLDMIYILPSPVQSARAANVVSLMLNFMRRLAREDMRPLIMQNIVPLCSWQYERIFCTTRIPGEEYDTLVHSNLGAKHIAVMHCGKYYKVYFYYNHKWLTACELEAQLIQILNDNSVASESERKLAALTAGERKTWARARKDFFHRGVNKASLDTIEKSAFVLVLDPSPANYDPNDDTALDNMAKLTLHGNGCDRWFDKSFNLVSYSSGRTCLLVEHSFADAPVMAQMWEDVAFYHDIYKEKYYDSNGHCLGEPENVPSPIRLKWDISEECLDVVNSQFKIATSLLEDVHLHLVEHNAFGKGLIKKCKVSPDAFIQMALQLAYYRAAGNFCLTYEASMTRLFKEGRTETVRSCTKQSSAFVTAMDDPVQKNDVKEVERLFREACDNHQNLYRDAMTGKGVDRHLFTLYVISKYLKIESPFLNEALQEPWRLSTSQTAHGQIGHLDLVKNPDFITPGGGFGPVSADGYGVSYIFAGEDLVFFHISSRVSCDKTDSRRFGRLICQAMQDIKTLCGQ